MESFINQYKKEYLDKLKAQKATFENRRQDFITEYFAKKKAEADAQNAKLDEAFAKYEQEKRQAYSKEIEAKKAEIIAKKDANISNAKQMAEFEANNEVNAVINKYDNEIAKIEKELA